MTTSGDPETVGSSPTTSSEPSSADQTPSAAAPPNADGEKQPIADRLVKYARARAKLFHTPEHEGYATIREEGHLETWPIKSAEFTRWIARIFYMVEGKVPYAQAVSSALNRLEGLALFSASTREVHLRYAWHKRRIYLDLANKKWEVVEIDGDGWRVIDDSPVKFVRPPGMRPLPIPVRGGSIEKLRPFLNLRTHNDQGECDDRDWILSVAWLLAAMRPTGPYPVLVLCGELGSAKSTNVCVDRKLLDPAEPAHRAPPKNEQE